MAAGTPQTSSATNIPINVDDIVYIRTEGSLLRGFLLAIVPDSSQYVICLDIRHRHLSPNKDGIMVVSSRDELIPYTTANIKLWDSEHSNSTIETPWSTRTGQVPSLKFKKSVMQPKSKNWKNLKQIVKQESAREIDLSSPSYLSIQGPPSLKPVKKYCDLTGALARYTHPRLHLRYSKAHHYGLIENMTRHTSQAYLDIRRANTDIK